MLLIYNKAKINTIQIMEIINYYQLLLIIMNYYELLSLIIILEYYKSSYYL